MKRSNVTGPRRSVKIATAATAVGLVGLGTGVSLASTGDPIAVQRVRGAQRAGGAANAGAVTCITEVDANAQAGAFTAASDLFAPGTNLRVSSGLQTVNVVVSGALNGNANGNNANAGNNGNANGGNNANANGGNNANGRSNKRKVRRNRGNNGGGANNDANAGNANGSTDNANAGDANAAGGNNANGGNNRRNAPRNRDNNGGVANNGANANNGVDANNNANNNAGNNDGVDPNSVCVKLSKAPFDKLSNNGNGENVGTFVVTMVPLANGGNGSNVGNGGNNANPNGGKAGRRR